MIRRNKALVKELSEPAPGAKDLYFATKFSQGTIGQFKSCLWKQWWTYWRTPEYNIVRMFFTLATALMLGTIFWKIGKKRDSSTDLNIIIGAMYASVLFIGVNNCSTVQPGQTVGFLQLADQTKIIAAIKEAGNIKRFFPSEFGNDVDRTNAVEPAKSAFETKAQIRRAVEAEGIPYTYVSSNCFGGYFLPNFSQPGLTAPPRDKVVILGDGNAKAVYNTESDIGSYTVKAVDDPRTLNKVLYIKPASNIYSFNELVSLWEKKIGKALEKSYLPEEQLLKNIQEAPIPMNVGLAIAHAIFVKGDQTNFEIEPSFGVEASDLYPEVKYTTVDEYLNQFV